MSQMIETRINSYLSFKLGDEIFAANAGKVINIHELCRITEVPKSPAYMKGVMNLRGKVLPVVDLRMKMGLSPAKPTVNTCIVVIDITIDNQPILIGVVVDSVQAVLQFEEDEMLPAPGIGSKYQSGFISGLVKTDDKFVMVLDLDAVFSAGEIVNMIEKTEMAKTN